MTSPLPAGTEMRRWAEAIHGTWDKSQERYADGFTSDDALAEWNATHPSPLPGKCSECGRTEDHKFGCSHREGRGAVVPMSGPLPTDEDEFTTGCTDDCPEDCMADHKGEQ